MESVTIRVTAKLCGRVKVKARVCVRVSEAICALAQSAET